MNWDEYFWPGTRVLRNKLDIRDAADLDRAERRLVRERALEGAPAGNFDLRHLRAIHHHLFQDVYEWAGEPRQHDMSKGGSAFLPADRIEMGMVDVHRRLEARDFLRGLTPDDFAARAGEIIGDVNHVHPFREGNGRTQLIYLAQLASQAGHQIDLPRLDGERWIEASIIANNHADSGPLGEEIARATEGTLRRWAAEQEIEAAQLRARLEAARLEQEAAPDRQRERGRER